MSLLQNSNAVTPSAGYDIDNSCRFNDHTDAFLYEVMDGDGSSELIWTLSFWTKISRFAIGSTATSYPAGYRRFAATKKTGSAINMEMGFRPNDNFVWYFWVDGSNHYGIETTPRYRDPSAWYHFTVIFNAPDSTAADRMQVWVNGERQTTTAYALGNPPNDKSTGWTSNGWTRMFGGSIANVATPTVQYPYPGYMAEVHCIDGQALAPSNFAETDENTNQWKAIEYAGTYGNNGFFFEFQTSGTLGTDTSGSGNNFTSSGMDFRDQMIDTPQNSTGGNFCTLNPLDLGDNGGWNGNMQEGNLFMSGTNGLGKSRSTFALDNTNGSYWEVRWGSATDNNAGISKLGQNNLDTSSKIGADPAYDETGYKGSTGVIDTDGSTEATYATSASGDILGFAYKAGRLYVGKIASAGSEAAWFNSGAPASGTGYVNASVKTDPTYWAAALNNNHSINFGQDSSFAGGVTAQGNTDSNNNGDFYGTVPTGYLALCTNNLADPEISLPGDHFNTVLYTGDASNPKTVSGVGFASDMVWLKARGITQRHSVYDKVRGIPKAGGSDVPRISPDDTSIESDTTDELRTITADGFTVDISRNGSGNTYVAWNWKADGTGSANTDGTINSTVSANATAGFSIIAYTGTGSTGTVGHGLSVAPDMVIVKELSGTAQWPVAVIQDPMNFTDYIALDKPNNYGDYNYWNDTPPTASVFSLSGDGDVNQSSATYISYCFHSVEGYSRVGSWTAIGTDPGPFFYCGFRPAWVMVKNMDRANSHWWIMDNKRSTYNMDAKVLFPDSDQVEASGRSECDFLSNGVKFRGVVNPESNYSSSDRYLIYAIAESPFKTANAR